MRNYTPFPWVAPQPNGRRMGWKVGPAWLGGPESETNDDAALISAAPDLLEALEEALQTAEFEQHGERPWHSKARSAIDKAKGQS